MLVRVFRVGRRSFDSYLYSRDDLDLKFFLDVTQETHTGSNPKNPKNLRTRINCLFL